MLERRRWRREETMKMEEVGDTAEAGKMEKGGDNVRNHSRGRRRCWNNEG
jgi:hypothetical protein